MFVAVAALAAVGGAPSFAADPAMTPVYTRASAPVEERVADLLSRMNLDEKLAQLRGGIGTERPSPKGEGAIPVLVVEGEAACGAPANFPRAIALASSWDPALVHEVHAALAREMRARGVRLALGPSLNVARDPRYGCLPRTFGEDPYLVGELGVAAVEGLQGSSSARSLAPGKVLAVAGNLAGYGPSDAAGTAPVSERELREVYFPPFEAVIKRTGVAALAPSRNEIDAIPSHANPWLLKDVLRDEWGFRGAVIGSAVGELQSVHHVAADAAGAALLALNAGVDVDLPDGRAYETLAGAVRAGRINESRIDFAVARILRLKLRAGLFDRPDSDVANVRTPQEPAPSSALALRAAQRSITLLKNDGVLPIALGASGRAKPRIAVVEIGGASISDAIGAGVRTRADLVAATAADFIVLAIAEPKGDAVESMRALKAHGKPIIVVLAGDVPAADVTLSGEANALLGAWSLGALGGNAVADVLFGDVNPGGKLPVTLARNAGQLPMFYNVKPSARRGYLFDSSEPLYPFGFGLGYSTFDVGAPRLSSTTMTAEGSVRISVDVRNTGRVAGDETVQVYIRDKVSSVTRPVKELKGFRRVTLAPGESRTLDFTLDAQGLALWDEHMRRVVEPGEFEIMAGPHSAQLKSATLTVTGGAGK